MIEVIGDRNALKREGFLCCLIAPSPLMTPARTTVTLQSSLRWPEVPHSLADSVLGRAGFLGRVWPAARCAADYAESARLAAAALAGLGKRRLDEQISCGGLA